MNKNILVGSTQEPETIQGLFYLVKNYSIEFSGATAFKVLETNVKKGYKDIKNALHDFAIDFTSSFNEYTSFYSEICFLSDFFSTYGARYGLLKEFKENCIV